jgi:uncharacterized protein (DUF433 family)
VNNFMKDGTTTYLNTGIYTVGEAWRLTGISKDRIRRWLRGYHSHLRKKNYPPLWKSQLPSLENKVALGFLDLIEIKFVDAFLNQGVSWAVIHRVREKAQKFYPETDHPFCTQKFFTDGHQILREVHEETGEACLEEIATDQRVFNEITKPFLKQLEFKDGTILERWWPLGTEHPIVVDPRKNFGQPTIITDGIPTQILAKSYRANGSFEEVAKWYEINPQSVQEAVEYEQSLAA